MGNEPRDWRDVAIAYIQSGEVDFGSMAEELGYGLAVELFQAAGVDIPNEERSTEWGRIHASAVSESSRCKRRGK